MPADIMKSILYACGLLIRSLQRRVDLHCCDQRGAVALIFAITALPITLAVATAVDFARIASGRAALQSSADNAALSGAAAYVAYAQGDALNAVAVSTAASAFCNVTTTLPSGYTLVASTGSKPCGAAQGPVVSAIIAGYQTGTPGIAAGSGCSATQTVVSGYTCGFTVTVTATAKTNLMFAGLLGASNTLSVTATAVNPFINLANALSTTLQANAWNANSIWVYPLLLDTEGQPDFSTNSGALPDTNTCTGDPTQTWCGSYSMVASTKYASCKAANPCTVNGTIFGGSGGIVQNIKAPSAVITATTPLGIALQSAAGGYQAPSGGSPTYNAYGYSSQQPPNNCFWPRTIAYNTIAQTYDSTNTPLIVDSSGGWTYPTHWFYSSYLANNNPPSQRLIDMQNNQNINPNTNQAFKYQVIKSVPKVVSGANSPATCASPATAPNAEKLVTTFPEVGSSNCSLFIVKNPTTLTADPSYAANKICFNPSTTPGRQYAALSCQTYGKSSYAFFWNDMGSFVDDYDYNNGVVLVNCSAVPKVILIN